MHLRQRLFRLQKFRHQFAGIAEARACRVAPEGGSNPVPKRREELPERFIAVPGPDGVRLTGEFDLRVEPLLEVRRDINLKRAQRDQLREIVQPLLQPIDNSIAIFFESVARDIDCHERVAIPVAADPG